MTSVSVIFSRAVTFSGNPADAFVLARKQADPNLPELPIINLQATVSTNSSGNTVVTLTFSTVGNDANVIDPLSAYNGGAPSLADGRYVLHTGALTSGEYSSPEDTASSGSGYYYGLYRLFGDENGDGFVDQVDLGEFRSAFNTSLGNPLYQWFLDANNDTNIDQVDLSQFRARFNADVFLL